MSEDDRILEAALRQNEGMRLRLSEIEWRVADLAKLIVNDRCLPSGEWGSTERMLDYLIAFTTDRKYGRVD